MNPQMNNETEPTNVTLRNRKKPIFEWLVVLFILCHLPVLIHATTNVWNFWGGLGLSAASSTVFWLFLVPLAWLIVWPKPDEGRELRFCIGKATYSVYGPETCASPVRVEPGVGGPHGWPFFKTVWKDYTENTGGCKGWSCCGGEHCEYHFPKD